MQELQIPSVSALKSVDAIAIRQIVASLIQAINELRSEVNARQIGKR